MDIASIACRLTALVWVLVWLSGCPNRWAEFRVVRLDSARVSSIDGAGFDMRMSCRVKNPNAVDATISNLSFTASVGKHRLGTGRQSHWGETVRLGGCSGNVEASGRREAACVSMSVKGCTRWRK